MLHEQKNLERIKKMFDPDFDPLELLHKTKDVVNSQQEMILSLMGSHNRLNKLYSEMAKTNTLLTNKIMKLEARIHAIEQTSAADRQRRE